MRTLILVFATLIFGTGVPTDTKLAKNDQDCQFELSVDKDRTFASADENGATFVMYLENKSGTGQIFTLSSKNLSVPCDNGSQGSKAASNVVLNVSIDISDNSKAMKKVKLDPGKKLEFRINIDVPKGTPYNSWSCIEIQATSDDCGRSSSEILSVFVPNPSEG